MKKLDGLKVRRALLSVSDKTGLVEFAKGLSELGVEIISTGGTARALQEAGVEVRGISDFTGFPEIMDGRVKTLHPRLHGALLARRDSEQHLDQAQEHGIELIDLVCVNLYPFRETVAKPDVTEQDAVENIDIGGPAMIRAAAKNHAAVAVVVSPDRYSELLQQLAGSGGELDFKARRQLAREAYTHTASYDAAVASWFSGTEEGDSADGLPALSVDAYEKRLELSYGENPHQRAAYYARLGSGNDLLSSVEKLGGKDLSFNNLLDFQSAKALLDEFSEPACVIVKHNNPCGCALGEDALAAYRAAFDCDPVSAFGGVICINRTVDKPLAEALVKQFIEVLYAPDYSAEALEVLGQKQNLRILKAVEGVQQQADQLEVRYVQGGLLVQDLDEASEGRDSMDVVSGEQPSGERWRDLLFAWKVCKHVRSNAIIIVRDGVTLGIGAGQMSRVDSVRLAVEKSQAETLKGAVLASDAFFPFADGPQLAIDAGVDAVIQPGGSIRDDEVITAAKDAGVTMVLTHKRHFRH